MGARTKRRINLLRGLQPLARAMVVISAVAILATGVTYAALQSQAATLSGNTIETATADLRIGTSATSYAASRTGFSFTNVVPGGNAAPADGNVFYLKNYGTAPLALKVSVGTTPTNTNGVDLTKVYVVLTRIDTSTTQKFSLASLVTANTTGGVAMTDNLAGQAFAQYKFQVSMDADAYSGTSASVGGIDLVFNGTVAP